MFQSVRGGVCVVVRGVWHSAARRYRAAANKPCRGNKRANPGQCGKNSGWFGT